MDDQGTTADVSQPVTPQPETPSVEDRLMTLLGGEDEPEQESEPDESDAEEESPQGDEGAEQPEAPEAEQEYDITWNGEAKRLKLSELREYAQKGFDYTQKTQEVSSRAQQIEQARQALVQREQILGALQEQVMEHQLASKKVRELMAEDLASLAQTDPLGALTKQIELQRAQMAAEDAAGKLRTAYGQMQAQQTAQQQQIMQREYERAIGKIAEWRNPEKRAAEAKGIREYLSREGYADTEIAGLADHRALIMARKAMLYDQLQAGKPAITKRVAEVGKVPPKSAGSQSVAQAKVEQLHTRLKKSGDMKDAAALLLARMK